MGHENRTFILEARGDYACFTRPEMKVERVNWLLDGLSNKPR